ncbi:hypothetical protein LTR08_003747 [Meristemomyces frigidus]|nr:hypothetical protein LTR08_003747 [Meristemomyces frigidus]
MKCRTPGISRTVLAVNGSVPGPTIEANWGDTVVIHVLNSLTANGTSIHFHGIRQNYTNPEDGVISITQCPTAPGDSKTYTWRATQYGSSWYHSHYALQAWDGVFGGINIHGPATADYDYDLGSLFLNDWDHQTASTLYAAIGATGPPTLQTGLINGTNTWLNGTVGTRFATTFESGSSYLIRLVNGAVDSMFDFSIDNHTLTVIASDFVPIVPYTATSVSIGMGQRYDIIVTADQASVATDFWLRATPDSFCSDNSNGAEIKGIVHYGDSTGTPSTTGYTIVESDCVGEALASLVPYLSLDASSDATVSNDDEATVSVLTGKWYVGSTSMNVTWSDPTALSIVNNETDWTTDNAVIECPTEDEWVMLIVETAFPVPHPIHLHGHDFFVLAAGAGTYADVAPTLNTVNPPRRDVTMLPASGYTVLAWQADNPGAWLLHCHIGWHTEEGFALQFVERYSEIAATYNSTALKSECTAWDAYQTSADLVQDDSGI